MRSRTVTGLVARVCAVFVLALFGASCTADLEETAGPAFHHAPTIMTDATSYTTAQSIFVSWTESPGAPDDWIAITAAGAPPSSGFVVWTYTNGQQAGNTTFGPLPAGSYEARSYVAGSYTILATTPFTVGGGPTTVTVSTDQAVYSRNEPITVNWTGTPGAVDDWVALVPAGSPANSGFIAWTYTNGQVNGMTTFSGIPVTGDYEARVYRAGTYTILGSSAFTVSSVTTSAPMYPINTPVTVNWDMIPATPANSFVSINTAGSPANSGFVDMFVVNGVRTGSHQFAGLAAGNYEARSYIGGTFTIIDSFAFTVSGNAPPPPSLSTDQTIYSPTMPITVSWVSMPGRAQDWVTIVPVGSPATSGFLQFFYVNSQVNGSQVFNPLPIGTYEARYYQEGTYTILQTATFQVTENGGTCTPAQNPPVLGGIQSGEITLTATDVEVTVPLSAPLATSILFTSAREREPSPNFGGVMCTLHDADPVLMLPAGVTCTRNQMGSDTGGQIVVRYTVATFTSGVTVQRGVANTGFTNPTVAPLTAVTPSQSFVLLNGIAVGGTGWGNNEFIRATLLDATNVEIRSEVAGSRVSWQVVDMTGAQVQRGTTTLASGATSTTATIAAAPTGSVVFSSYTTDNVSAIAASALSVATTLTNPTTVTFSRGGTGAAVTVSYEVVSLPFSTVSGTANMAAGQTSVTAPAIGASPSATVAVMSSQSILGQSTGSTTYSGMLVDLVGEAAATVSVGSGSVTLQRASSDASASFPWTLIDFAHNCNGSVL